MPKKKDPRLRAQAQPPQRQFFDSAEYEVQRAQAKSTLQKKEITTQQSLKPHVGLGQK